MAKVKRKELKEKPAAAGKKGAEEEEETVPVDNKKRQRADATGQTER